MDQVLTELTQPIRGKLGNRRPQPLRGQRRHRHHSSGRHGLSTHAHMGHAFDQAWGIPLPGMLSGDGTRMGSSPVMEAPKLRTRRSKFFYLALLVGSTVAAFWITKEFQVARMAATAVTLLPTLPGLYLAWRAYDADRAESAERGLPETAELLAAAVRLQWEAEAQVRRLNDPHPLPVAWQPAGATLVEDWPFLEMTARSWPSRALDDPASWASSPSELAGENAQITDVLTRRVPTGRLVVLGRPGAGKTMLLIRLVLDLLARRSSGQPVPVLVPLASWNPAEDDLHTWLVNQLTTDYPALKELVPTASGMVTCARALLDQRMILLILDGLDEIPDAVRGASIARINDALRPGEGAVLSCRTGEYRDAVRGLGATPVVLRGAAGITLGRLADDDVAAYLRRDAGAAAARWAPVLARLGTRTPVAQALHTPLMVSLARAVYNPRPGESTATLPDPAELCDTSRFRTSADVESHLFDAFIPAAYRPHPQRRCPWTARRAERALVYLARHLDRAQHGAVNIAWWEISRAVPWYLTLIASVLVSGVVFGLTSGIVGSVLFGPRFGIARCVEFGLVNGVITGLTAMAGSRPVYGPAPADGFRWSWGRFTLGLAGGLVAGLAFSLAGGLTHGLAFGTAAGLAVGLAGALRRSPADLTSPVGPATLLTKDRKTLQMTVLAGGVTFALLFGFSVARGLMFDLMRELATSFPARLDSALTIGLTDGFLFGFAGGLLFAIVGERAAGPVRGLAFTVMSGLFFGFMFVLDRGPAFGLVAGVAFGLASGLAFSAVSGLVGAIGAAAWGSFTAARIYHALRGHLPLRLMTFLADAHQHRGVLRQMGAVYQFRHVELQRHLARRT